MLSRGTRKPGLPEHYCWSFDALCRRMSRLVVRGAVIVRRSGTVIWQVSDPMVMLAGLTSVREPDLDALAADHHGAADRDPSCEVSGPGSRGGPAVPARAPRSRCWADWGTGQATVRTRLPLARMWATSPSRRRVTRCPASGDPALMTWLPTVTLPEALTIRSMSMTPPAGGGSGSGPAGTAPQAASLARSVASSRDERILIRWPSART